MKLKDLCVLDVACCTREVTVSAAARLMRERHTGDVIVVDDADEDREPVGILTDRDIVIEVLAKGRDPDKTTVAEIMATQLVVAGESEDSTQALQRMAAHGVRRIPVVDDERCVVGIITLDDLLREQAEQATRLLEVVTKQQSKERRARR
ncbi:MAG TPA: CBS domain-containing protein [Steroidobacteraceae bacterium]|jgi:CBS domain-containing protein|nr:CBS domain-containing protein [Steroidobacteraceae bacterium]